MCIFCAIMRMHGCKPKCAELTHIQLIITFAGTKFSEFFKNR